MYISIAIEWNSYYRYHIVIISIKTVNIITILFIVRVYIIGHNGEVTPACHSKKMGRLKIYTICGDMIDWFKKQYVYIYVYVV